MKKYITICLCLVYLCIITGCTSEDPYYKEFLNNSNNRAYPGKMDSLKIRTGFKRVEVSGKLSSDPQVKGVLISWNNRKNSLSFDITSNEIARTKSFVIPGLNDGYFNFELQTKDKHDNLSIPIEITGFVYGDEYQKRLINRAISQTGFNGQGQAYISWSAVNDIAMVGTKVHYTRQNQAKDSILVLPSQSSTQLVDYKSRSNIEISSLYMPKINMIDTVYSTKSSFKIE